MLKFLVEGEFHIFTYLQYHANDATLGYCIIGWTDYITMWLHGKYTQEYSRYYKGTKYGPCMDYNYLLLVHSPHLLQYYWASNPVGDKILVKHNLTDNTRLAPIEYQPESIFGVS